MTEGTCDKCGYGFWDIETHRTSSTCMELNFDLLHPLIDPPPNPFIMPLVTFEPTD